MTVRVRRLLPRLAITVCLLASGSWLAAIDHPPLIRVLVLQSYHPAFPTFFRQIEGVRSVLDPALFEIDFEFLDTKRFTSEEYYAVTETHLRQKIDRLPPYDGVITADDNALRFAMSHRDELFPGAPIVFSGVNNLEYAYSLEDDPLVSGVVEAVSMAETLRVIADLFPNVTTVWAIADGTPSGQGDLTTFYDAAEAVPDLRLTELSLEELSFAELRERLAALGDEDAVLLLSVYHDATGETVLFREGLAIITEDLDRPLFHLWYHGMGDGILGGILISHYEQTSAAARIMRRILVGRTPTSAIPIVNRSPNVPVFDWREMQRFEITRRMLPPQSQVLHAPQSVYREYRAEFFVGLFAIIALSTMLLALLHNRERLRATQRHLERSLREKEVLLREVHHRVKNNLALILSLLNLQRDTADSEESRTVIDSIQTRIYSMAVFHEKIYETTDVANIDLNDYFRTLGGYTTHIYSSLAPRLRIRYDIEPGPLEPTELIALGLVATEAMTNAMKHAFTGAVEPEITLFFGLRDGVRVLEIRDNGNGTAIDTETTSVGISIMKALAKQVGGTIRFVSDGGTRVIVSLAN